MRALATIRLRTLGWFVLLPLTFMGWVPWWLHRQCEGAFHWSATRWQWIGVWLLLNGLGLSGWCVNLLNVVGQGTPVPFDPPSRFVATGPYRVVRNPMAVGFFLMLAGEALLYQSRAIAIYLLAIMGAIHTFVCWVEEPNLTQRFGATYTAYKRAVPRWIPHAPSSKTR